MDLRPREIRPVPPAISIYFRPGARDHKILQELLSEGAISTAQGILFDPCRSELQSDLRQETLDRNLEAVLDTHAMELALAGGRTPANERLSWAGDEIHGPDQFTPLRIHGMTSMISVYLGEYRQSAILAPTHYLAEGSADPWLAIDRELTISLREKLDSNGMKGVPIYYPLALPCSRFATPADLQHIKGVLAELPIDAIWLRLHPFGASAGPRVLRRTIEACRMLHELGLPIVGERTGTIGLPLVAFGAVGGIESGITMGENFDIKRLSRPLQPTKGFGPQYRVYISEIQAFLARKDARAFFSKRSMKASFGCTETACCRFGSDDMIHNPRRHYLISRVNEVRRMSAVAEPLRSRHYMEEILRPATDKIIRAEKVAPSLSTTRSRLEKWRYNLGALESERSSHSFSAVPQGRRLAGQRGA